MAAENKIGPAPPTSSLSVTKTVNGSHKFAIQGYSLTKGMGAGKHVASENFTVGGFDWAVYFYPDGKNPYDNSAYVSVFIALVSEATNVRALFEIVLVDQSGKGKHRVHSHFDRSLEGGPYTIKYRGSMWGYKRFFRRSSLEASDYLKDDCVRLNCTVGVVVSSVDYPRLHSIKVPESQTSSQFGALLDNEECSDITLNVSGEKFHAHKIVLAARSHLFQSKFLEEFEDNDSEVEITDIEPEVFKAMLHYIYRDSLSEDVELESCTSLVSDSLTAKLLAAAGRYGLDRLRLLCESHICKDISVETVGEILALADRSNASDLKGVCLRFAAENLSVVMETDAFKILKDVHPPLLSELLKTASRDHDSSSDAEMSHSVWAQQLSGGDSNGGRGVKQKT